ncbi:MAG: hypothetical protein Kow001_22140 [Acidobacteriota bacterium]
MGRLEPDPNRSRAAGLSLLEVMVSMLLVSLAAVSLVHLLVMALRIQSDSLARFRQSRERWNRMQVEEAQEPLAGAEIRVLDWERGWILWDGALPPPDTDRGSRSRGKGKER